MRFIVAVMLLALTPLAHALRLDAALITQLQGEASVESAAGAKRSAVPFLKLTAGEKVQLKAATKVQLVYFESGRQETWSGVGQLEIGTTDGMSASLKPEVRQLSPLLVKQLARTPGAGQHGRAGMVVTRSLPTPAKVERLEKQYTEFRQQSSADDLTPEVFYLSGLIELKELGRAQAVLSMLRARQGDAAAHDLVEHFAPLAESLRPALP